MLQGIYVYSSTRNLSLRLPIAGAGWVVGSGHEARCGGVCRRCGARGVHRVRYYTVSAALYCVTRTMLYAAWPVCVVRVRVVVLLQ